MHAKLFEVRDRATFIPVLAVNLKGECAQDMFLLRHCGYGLRPSDTAHVVMLTRLQGESKAQNHFSNWDDRTMRVAHEFIQAHWDDLFSGDVVDVEFALGECKEPKVSEAYDKHECS